MLPMKSWLVALAVIVRHEPQLRSICSKPPLHVRHSDAGRLGKDRNRQTQRDMDETRFGRWREFIEENAV